MKKIILILMIMATNAFGTNITYRFTYGAQWLDDSLEFTTFYKDGSAYDSISFNAVGTDHIDSAAVYPDTCPILIKIRGWIDGEVWYSTINIDLSNKHDTAAFARAGWDNNVIAEVNRTVGNVTALATGAIDSGDFGSTYWAAMQNDSAANARANWDNDIVAEVNRTVGMATSVTGLATGAIDSSDLASTYWAAMQNDSAANARYIWNLPFATAWVAGSMGDSMNNSSYVQGSAVTAWNSTQRDSVLQTIADAGKLGRIIDSLNAILDSLQSQDNWVAKEATINTEVGNIDGWNPITDNDSLIGDQSTNTATAIVDTAAIGRSVWDFDIVDSTGRIVVVRPINTQGDTLARQKDSAIMQGQAAGITVAGVIDSMIKQGFVTYSLGQDSTLLLKRVAISGANGAGASVNIVNTSTTSPVGIKVDVSSANAAGRAVQLSGSASSYGLLAQAGSSLYPTMAIKCADGSAGKLYSIQDSKIDSIYDTIKAANGWVATQANQQTIVINIAQNKDSIQKIRDSIDDLSPVIHAINPVSDSLFETLTVIHAALDTLGIIIPDSLNDTLTAIHNAALNAGVPDSLFDSLTAIHAAISDSDRLFSADKDLLINRITDSLNLVTIPVNVKEMEDTEYAEIAHYTGDTSWNFPFRGLTEMPQNLVRNGSFEAESLGTYLTESNIFPKGWSSYFYGTAHVIIKEVTGSNQIYSSGGKKYMEVNGDAIGDSAQFLSSPFNVKSGGYVIYGITARKGSGASITCYLHNDNDNSRLDTLNNDITSLEGITYTKIYKVPPILDDIGIEFEIFVNAETSFVYLDGTFAYYYPKLDTLDIDSISQITADLLAGGISVTCSGMGMGGVSIKVKVADTSGADAAITGAWVSLNTMAGVPYAGQLTNTSGQANFFANVNDTLVASVTIPGYVIPKSDTLPIIAGGVSDSIKGYDMITAPPGSADLCRVYLNVVDGSGNYLEGVKMTASIQNTSGGVIDTCAGTPIGQYTMGSTLSDASGYLYIDLIKSKCLNNQQKYKFIITYPSGQSFGKGPFTVPDSSTWKLTW